MINNIELQNLKNEYPEFFEQISPDLLEFIFSEKTSSDIAEICLKNGIENGEKIEKIAYRIVLVLLGQTPKENLPEILEKEVELSPETAKQVVAEINQFILSKIEENQQVKRSPLIPELVLGEEKPKGPPKNNIYQEPIE